MVYKFSLQDRMKFDHSYPVGQKDFRKRLQEVNLANDGMIPPLDTPHWYEMLPDCSNRGFNEITGLTQTGDLWSQ